GKSTTLKCISGLIKAQEGEILFENKPIQNMRPEKIVEKGIIHVPEGRKLFSLMTVKENLIVGAHNARAHPHKDATLKEVYQLLPRLGEREKQQAITLSGGEQQMVAIGRGMMAKPKILMMDEPSLGLAPVLIKEIFVTIRKIAEQGTTVLLVEQDVQHSLSISDRGYVLEHGRISMEGTGKELLEDPQIREAYLGI
ncbi:ABC transporter ATP-binding protein, partial [bacterium]|nr:ABC transporter ATP-binding protein [bacterium]